MSEAQWLQPERRPKGECLGAQPERIESATRRAHSDTVAQWPLASARAAPVFARSPARPPATTSRNHNAAAREQVRSRSLRIREQTSKQVSSGRPHSGLAAILGPWRGSRKAGERMRARRSERPGPADARTRADARPGWLAGSKA